jgi:hypothetical protein
LLVHWARRAASRAACTAGSKSAINTAMIAITTRSSISVNAARHRDGAESKSHLLGVKQACFNRLI